MTGHGVPGMGQGQERGSGAPRPANAATPPAASVAAAAATAAGMGAGVGTVLRTGTLARLQRGFRAVTTIILAVLLVALTAVTVIDVLGRYLFNHPLPGGTELTELLVMATIFAGLPAICLDDGHVTVDMLVSRLRGGWDRAQLALVRLFVAAVLGLVAWQLIKHGLRLASYTQTTVYLHIPLAPVAMIAAVICAAAAVLSAGLALSAAPRG